jgi:1-acyl-sn-glycerol-3-phosphate acyltransferase
MLFKTLCTLRFALWFVWTLTAIIPLALLLIISSPFSGWRWLYRIANWWGLCAIYGMKWICGVHWRIKGVENLPKTPNRTIVLSKHQSTWETLAYLALSPTPLCFVYKKELNWLPFFGWAIASMKMIHIDRSHGGAAFKKIAAQGRRVLQEKRWVIMFPEGTRAARGKVGNYKSGGTRLAIEADAQVLPVAVSSAKCWPKGGFSVIPGTVEISIGHPISSQGQSPDLMLSEVKRWIESEMLLLDPPHEGPSLAALTATAS